jgi:hypothetical protein
MQPILLVFSQSVGDGEIPRAPASKGRAVRILTSERREIAYRGCRRSKQEWEKGLET